MLFEKFSNEILDHFIGEINKDGRLDKFKKNLIEPTIVHVSKYFNKYILYFYTILILLIAFIILLIIIMLRLMTKLETLNELVLNKITV